MTSNDVNHNVRMLSRKEALEEGAILDLTEIEAAHGLPEALGIKFPLAITYAAYSESFDYRQMLLALKSVLRFALYQGETVFRVPLQSSEHDDLWLKVLREIEAERPVLTIMMRDEGRSSLITLRQ